VTLEHPLTEAPGSDRLTPPTIPSTATWEDPDGTAPDDPSTPTSRSSRSSRRAARRGVEARQVTRVIRRVQPWSVFRVALVFSIALWLIVVIAAVIIWQVARATGAIGHLESFLGELLADKSFKLDGDQLLRAAGLSGLVLVVAGTGFAVLLTLLFNVISELTGGLRLSVIELETARRPAD